MKRPKGGNFSNCESVTLDYSEDEPSSALGYLPAAIPGLCHSFAHIILIDNSLSTIWSKIPMGVVGVEIPRLTWLPWLTLGAKGNQLF